MTIDDYINMRLLVDVAEHTNDDVALTKLREYIEAVEQLSKVRARARSHLPIPPLRVRDSLPAFTAARGGISVYPFGADFSAEAAQLRKRRDAVIALFRTINEIQWGNGVNDITIDDLDTIAEAIDHARMELPAEVS